MADEKDQEQPPTTDQANEPDTQGYSDPTAPVAKSDPVGSGSGTGGGIATPPTGPKTMPDDGSDPVGSGSGTGGG